MKEIIDSIDDSRVVQFVNKILHDAVDKGAKRVHFERHENSQGITVCFRIIHEIDGKCNEVAQPPAVYWQSVISRLKVLARMADYGPRKSTDGEFALPLANGQAAIFKITTNPNPSTERRVTLVLDGET